MCRALPGSVCCCFNVWLVFQAKWECWQCCWEFCTLVPHACCMLYVTGTLTSSPPAKTPSSAYSSDYTALAHAFAFVTSWKPCHCEISSFSSFVTSWCCLTMLLPANSPDTTSILHSKVPSKQLRHASVSVWACVGGQAVVLHSWRSRTHPPVHGSTAPTRVCYFDSLAVEPLRNLLCYLSFCVCGAVAAVAKRGGVGGVWRTEAPD